jgi:hypothetical protein
MVLKKTLLRAIRRPSLISKDAMLLVGGISRSGTTLLTTILDAHPDLTIGAELIPGPLPSPAELLEHLDRALSLVNGEFDKAGHALRNAGDRNLGLFFMRCHRAGVDEKGLRASLASLSKELSGPLETWRDRLLVAWAVMRTRAIRAETKMFGFKLNSASIGPTAELFPNAHFVCLVRDPYDVALSQLKRKFDRSIEEIAKAWAIYAKKYADFAQEKFNRCLVIRYEDLVRSPRRTLKHVFEVLPVEIDECIFTYYRSDASIFASSHPNLDRLRMNFSTDSIGLGRIGLEDKDKRIIERFAGEQMLFFGYDKPGLSGIREGASHPNFFFKQDDTRLCDLSPRLIEERNAHFVRQRKFFRDAYEVLLAPYLHTHRNMRLGDFVRLEDVGDDRFLLIRHDVDHDIETAVKIAKWEQARGLRSTFCLLHTSWYYGIFENGRYRHSRQMLEGAEQILACGHEINFHNNLVVFALQTGIEPTALLEQELEFFHRMGIPIVGTSTHGDRLCRELNFRNWELFQECCDGRFGGPRDVEHIPESGPKTLVPLGSVSMRTFGLEYEAYDIARDIYHTDSGGNMRTVNETPGRRMFGRTQGKGQVVGILLHPIWWDFGKE